MPSVLLHNFTHTFAVSSERHSPPLGVPEVRPVFLGCVWPRRKLTGTSLGMDPAQLTPVPTAAPWTLVFVFSSEA